MQRRLVSFPCKPFRPCALALCAALLAATAGAQPADEWTIETVAGGGVGDGGPATAAYLIVPNGVAVDSVGNLYIADTGNHRIRKVTASTGNISTAAGTGTTGFSGDGGPATEAQLYWPGGVAVDSAGNLYIADTANHRIRKVTASTGNISTAAGTGIAGFRGDGAAATSAQINRPRGVAVDGSGNLYIADTENHRIRKVDASTGNISTAARGGLPRGVAVDSTGNLYIADTENHRIRKMDADGLLSTVAGTGILVPGDGVPAVRASLHRPTGLAVDGAGNLYIANAHSIHKVDASTGNISTVAGGGKPADYLGDGGPATEAQLNYPSGVAVDTAGNFYIADSGNHRIRKVDVDGNISTAAGKGSYGGDGGPATSARLSAPYDVAVDAEGNLYIADTRNQRIRKVDADGNISTAAGTGTSGFSGDGGPATEAQLRSPRSVAVDGSGNLYIADQYTPRIRKIDAAGNISTVAGTGENGGSGDGGPATEAQLGGLDDVAVDTAGNLYIAAGGRIRKVDTAGVITTFAGGGPSGLGDGGPATAAQLSPSGVALDGAGNVYIADGRNRRIRRVDTGGNISTIAGTGTRGYSGDGGPATEAQLNYPSGVAVDAAGNVYIADFTDLGNHSIRRVDTGGNIFTIAGTGRRGFSGDGGPATSAQLYDPYGVAADAAGNLYIADRGNHRIRRLTPPPGPRISAGGVILATGAPVVKSISPNAIISLFGREFAPEGTRAANAALDNAGRVATELAGLCLEIDGKRAPLFAVFPGQINAQAPHDLTPGQAQVRAIGNCDTEDEQHGLGATVEVAALAPAFFNFPIDAGGRNPIVALRGNGPELVGLPGAVPGVELVPAEPGEIVTFFGTGFGPTEPPLEAGQIPGAVARLTGEIEFAFGGITLFPDDVLYAGAAPCCAGLYQFTMRVPRRFPDSLRAPVVATIDGVSTPEGPFLTVRGRE